MEETNSEGTRSLTAGMIGFLVGTITGIIVGLLVAPQSGSRTREQLHGMAEDACTRVDEWTDDAKETVDDWVKKGKKVVGA